MLKRWRIEWSDGCIQVNTEAETRPCTSCRSRTIISWILVYRPSFNSHHMGLKNRLTLFSFLPSSSGALSLLSRIPFHPPFRPFLHSHKFEPWPATGDPPSPATPTRPRSPTGSTSPRRPISLDSSSVPFSMVCQPNFPSIPAHLIRLSRYRYRSVLPVLGRDIQHQQSCKGRN